MPYNNITFKFTFVKICKFGLISNKNGQRDIRDKNQYQCYNTKKGVLSMKVLICDDDDKIIDEIISLLNKFNIKRNLLLDIKSYSCGADILKDYEKYDIAFVDIEMPKINGLSVTKHLQKRNSNIIVFIVTSFHTYLDDAMDLNIFRYLSKPLDECRFMKSMNIAVDIYQKSTQSIVAETYDECFNILTKDILYITIQNRKASIVTKDKKILSRNNFNFWKKQLAEYDYFVQPHYSFIVNLKNVTHFNKTEITLSINEKECIKTPISRRFYSSFKEAFYKYVGVTV